MRWNHTRSHESPIGCATTRSVHDTSDLEIRGLPSVYVATTEFEDGADTQAKALGVDHSPVYVPHPIQDRTDDEMVKIGEQAFEAILAKLVQQG